MSTSALAAIATPPPACFNVAAANAPLHTDRPPQPSQAYTYVRLCASWCLQKAGADAVTGSGDDQEGAGSTGIILKRQAKPTAAAGGKIGDLSALRDSVQKLCSSVMPLARNMEYLQEDMDSLAKEFRCGAYMPCLDAGACMCVFWLHGLSWHAQSVVLNCDTVNSTSWGFAAC